MKADFESLVEKFKAGESLALARAISLVENGEMVAGEFLERVGERSACARRIGITGPPGAGKSTLIAALTSCFGTEEKVGIVLVDPTSPFSGGALLGDRIRMAGLSQNSDFFIRSMASRGSLGGLFGHSEDVMDLMSAFGFTRIVLETIGVGQAELEVNNVVDSVIVVLVPESGDGIQAMKAGLMEVADLFVINKSDRPGADCFLADLEVALDLFPEKSDDETGLSWKVPIVKTIATVGEGIQDLLGYLEDHHNFLQDSGKIKTLREERIVDRIRAEISRQVHKSIWTNPEVASVLTSGLRQIDSGGETVHSVAENMIKLITKKEDT